MLQTGRNCWRIERAQRAALIVDAADYFRLARQAMLKARSQILLIGWDFDTRIDLDTDEADEAPTELGAFITWLPKKTPGLQVHILKWDVGAIKLLGRGTTIFRLARWAASDNIHFKLDGVHPVGASHHHKIVVIDDRLAFCGGIDMAADRWDTREHRDKDPGRRRPTTRRRYDPWHDATMALDGPAAKALGDHARHRWKMAGGTPLRAPATRQPIWPKALKPMFREVDVAISRTRGAAPGQKPIREIEALFCDQIARARRFIYAENQYFASRKVGEAILKRLGEKDCPEIVIINPESGQGWLDDTVMGPARARLLRAIAEADRNGRFRIYSPLTKGGEGIYVHAKILIVDGELLRVGSANFNNRSMGLDSECDVTIDAALPANRAATAGIGAVLDDLLAEHLGATPRKVKAQRARLGLIGAIEALRGRGRTLVPLDPGEPSELEKTLAETEALDPESAGEAFEPIARPGLLARLRR
jgi:phosphatidylserine/phosphatidylglycerophosphate/cardiolipin synthase-like enzyme